MKKFYFYLILFYSLLPLIISEESSEEVEAPNLDDFDFDDRSEEEIYNQMLNKTKEKYGLSDNEKVIYQEDFKKFFRDLILYGDDSELPEEIEMQLKNSIDTLCKKIFANKDNIKVKELDKFLNYQDILSLWEQSTPNLESIENVENIENKDDL